MSQLKMIAKVQKPTPRPLAEGYSVRLFTETPEDIDAWVRISKNGILGPDAGRQAYTDMMLGKNNYHPDDVFFVEENGYPVATICAIAENPPMGNVHMVTAEPSCRGKGIGHYITWLAMDKLYREGMKQAYLTTDDWRVPAIRCYVQAGFKPVLYEPDMLERWKALLPKIGVDRIEGIDNEGNFIQWIE